MRLLNHGRQFSTHRREVECHSMIEDSPESFISRWREHAASVELFPRTEGSPLLEARAGQTLLQLFERTGPYLSRPGRAQVIIHPVTESVERLPDASSEEGVSSEVGVEVTGVSRFEVRARVVTVDGHVAVMDAGMPLVVGILNQQGAPLAPGELVRFSTRPPAHAFVLTDDRRSGPRPNGAHHDDTI